MTLDFEEMRRIYRLEKNTSRLVEIPVDFFEQLYSLIDSERAKYFDSLKDLNATRARDFGNLKKLVDEWFVVREKKILNSVLISAQMGEKDVSRLTGEEQKLFDALYDALLVHRETAKSVLEAQGDFVPMVNNESPDAITSSPPAPSTEDAEEETTPTDESSVEEQSVSPSNDRATSIRVLSEIPSFVGTDMKEYGPFKVGETVELPGKIAQLFITRHLGEPGN